MNPIQEVEAWAKEYDKTLRADDPRFAGAVVVVHEEGTFLHFRSAFVMRRYATDPSGVLGTGPITFYCVFTEHHKFHIYHFEDAKVYSYAEAKIEDSN